jgi:hypothetical protein
VLCLPNGAGSSAPPRDVSLIFYILDYCKTLERTGMVPFSHEFSFESSWKRCSTGSCESWEGWGRGARGQYPEPPPPYYNFRV